MRYIENIILLLKIVRKNNIIGKNVIKNIATLLSTKNTNSKEVLGKSPYIPMISHSNIVYPTNIKNTIGIWEKDNICTKILSIVHSVNIGDKDIILYTSNPIYYHTLSTVHIVYFVYRGSSTIHSQSILVRIVNMLYTGSNVTTSKNSIQKLLGDIYGKEIFIEPIYLQYNYLDSSILSQVLSNNILYHKRNNLLTRGVYNNILYNSIPLTNYSIVNIQRKNIHSIQKSLYSYDILLTKMLHSNTTKYIVTHNSIRALLHNSYIIGYQWSYSGKRELSESNSRSYYTYYNTGILHSSIHSKNYILHSHKDTISHSKIATTNKNGMYSIRTILSHI
uniref:Small ribosomal subunit protein uS3m n=1 Tax=Diddensiella santjacobensis TaxID=2704139 RepID=S5TMT6_9ASCO|nr:ribosomal protein S3 [Diddensiella santjacobensis]AGS44130.1 ribosomal protein S3 [Diddensiella santjacobensis]